jgi:acetylglutamate kinase
VESLSKAVKSFRATSWREMKVLLQAAAALLGEQLLTCHQNSSNEAAYWNLKRFGSHQCGQRGS